MLFVCWLWKGHGFWKDTAKYNARHVEVLASMLCRHGGHDLVCVTDVPDSISSAIKTIAMPEEVSDLPNYLPKLWAWSPEFHALIGRRFVSIDLDVVITGDLGPVLETKSPLRIWNKAALEPYNTSLFSLKPGFGNAVWNTLTPELIDRARSEADYWTGDQSWVAYVLGRDAEAFGEETGVIQYRPARHRDVMPVGMKAGFFSGPFSPETESPNSAWVKEVWQ
jgi:hypothetical protein